MKKIGIVGFFSRENYGAILQAIALQYKLNALGFEAKYINYAPKVPIKGLKRIVNRTYGFVRYFLGYRNRLKRTNIFRDKFLKRSAPINKLLDVSKIISAFDIFVVGSDQVWHPRWFDVSQGYYLLKFVENKPKFSYASSFGVSSFPDRFINNYKEELRKFNAISVREQSGVEILKNMGIPCLNVLDPTLLLSKEEWLGFFIQKPLISTKYIFCYVMTGDHKSARFIANYANRINAILGECYKIVVVGDKEYKRFKPNYNLICDAGPAEFLNLIYNASYVVTNSFHGTCFSINFGKQFTTVLDIENPVNGRITDLLSKLSLSSAILYTNSDQSWLKKDDIDFSEVEKKLFNLRNFSICFLTDSIALS